MNKMLNNNSFKNLIINKKIVNHYKIAALEINLKGLKDLKIDLEDHKDLKNLRDKRLGHQKNHHIKNNKKHHNKK